MSADPRALLDEIKARAGAATEGPWRVWPDSRIEHEAAVETSWSHDPDGADTELIADCCPIADAEFIAHARTDAPAMAAALTAVLGIEARDPAELVEPDAWTVGHVEGFNAALACMEAAITSALGGDRG